MKRKTGQRNALEVQRK